MKQITWRLYKDVNYLEVAIGVSAKCVTINMKLRCMISIEICLNLERKNLNIFNECAEVCKYLSFPDSGSVKGWFSTQWPVGLHYTFSLCLKKLIIPRNGETVSELYSLKSDISAGFQLHKFFILQIPTTFPARRTVFVGGTQIQRNSVK